MFCDNSAKRWNGNDTTLPRNNAPTWILPRTPPAPPVQVQVVNVYQHLKKAWAHYDIRTIATVGHTVAQGASAQCTHVIGR